MKQTFSYKKNLRYRYYTCYNHIKFKSCSAHRSSFPAEPIEQQVISEIVRILKSPEVVMHLNYLTEEDKMINKTQLLSALKNLNSVWHYLYQAEQKKIVDMLVNNVIVKEDGLKINLNLDGFDPLTKKKPKLASGLLPIDITDKHRLVYDIDGAEIHVVHCKSHYNDNANKRSRKDILQGVKFGYQWKNRNLMKRS